MQTEEHTYFCHHTKLKGYFAWEKGKPPSRPGILIAPAWNGLDAFAKQKAQALAKLGYVAMAVDLYGDGITANSNEEALALMAPLFLDRVLLQERIKSGYDALRKHPLVDPQQIGGIGFCFGGLTMIELFRSGVDLKGVVSFHAVLGNTLEDKHAKTVPISPNIKGSILILHGYDDPLVSAEDLARIQKELADAKIDWQLHVYGNTSHAFTNPQASDQKAGLIYNPKADQRSWQLMNAFFSEIFTM